MTFIQLGVIKTGARKFSSAPLPAKFGMVVIALYVLAAIFAPQLAPYGEAEIVGTQFEPWSSTFWLGTDNLGRDMFTRLIYGARNTIGIALLTTALAFSIGSTAGLAAATFSGWTDQLLSRAVDVLMSIPQLIFALLLLSIFGTSIPSLIIIIAVLDSTRVFRLTRAVSINAAVSDYVEAARLRGEGPIWIMGREIMPNILPTLTAEFGLRFCFVFLLISGLSFLGVGIQPPTADWGSMVRDTATLIAYGDITPLLPALAIALLAVSVNLIVDWFLHSASGLRD
ncbi:ABC transporter permease [Mesorhizobium loti]|uniref:ABC transporter permease n=1 Tax=Rhizobium loti TaxID=381 RepID=A0A101KP18_RHILI|nr:ABC transporter permease [Mesorhizobium loti]